MAHVFKEGKMASNHLDTYLANVIFQSSAVNAPVYDGTLVKLGNLVPDTTYRANGGYEYDTYYATAAASTDKLSDVAFIDMADINEVASGVDYNAYKLGYKLYDLQAEAGKIVRARRLAMHDKFWLGADNFASTVTVGTTTIELADATIKVLADRDLNAGMHVRGKLYLCEVCTKVSQE